MKHELISVGDYKHVILYSINGWELLWFWYGGLHELTDDLHAFIHETTLDEYIKFCTEPHDSHYFNQPTLAEVL